MTKDELIKSAQLAVTKLQMSAYGINIRDADEIDALCEEINNALDAQIKACDVPKIEGLGEALKVAYIGTAQSENDDPTPDPCIRVIWKFQAQEILQAAHAFHKITGGDDAV